MTTKQQPTRQTQPVASPSEGASLHAWLQERIFSSVEVLQIMGQTAEALETLHGSGALHQHITPWNLFWSPGTQTLSLPKLAHNPKDAPGEAPLLFAQSPANPLFYISPEQAGQVTHRLDCRTDLYSLGVVAWHLLVGRPPFEADEPQALLHAHLATRPTPPHKHRDDIPLVLSEIVLKLLAKRLEDRYQSARGLKLDVQKGLDALDKGDAAHFVLGSHDRFLLLLHSQQLYGRAREQKQLHNALRDAQEGSLEFILVQGAPGIGKTSLVQSLADLTYESQGHFARGRFALMQGESPYLAFQTALRGLLQELMAEDKARLLYWRTLLKQALGENDGVLTSLLPELGHLLGEVSAITPLPSQEERIRIQKVFSDLIRALASPQHPLVLFLDDLQWADSASLALIEFLATDRAMRGFVLIGGFRDSEAGDSPHLNAFSTSIKQRHVATTSIILHALNTTDLQQMLSALCQCTPDKTHSLASILWKKTAGNPFFIQVLLQQIYQERLLWMDGATWSWDEDKICTLAVTDNVVSLLVDSLQQQSKATQQALQIAACLGHQFQTSDLAHLLDISNNELLSLLQPCLDQHLLSLHSELLCRFTHDRVREAVYALMTTEESAANHIEVGRYLLAQSEDIPTSESLYDIISHLQQGQFQAVDEREREQFVQLARNAGLHARRAGAFESALGFVDWGVNLLGTRRWETHYEQTLSLVSMIAEIGVACHQRERIEQYIDELLSHGRTLEDQLPGWKSRILLLIGEHKMQEAIDVTNHFFALTHTPLLQQDHPLKLLWNVARVFWQIGRRQPEDLLKLPSVSDPLTRGILDLQVQISMAYGVAKPELVPTMILRDLSSALHHGLTDHNMQCWTGWGAILSNFFGKISLGRRYGDLATAQVKRMKRPGLASQIELFKLVAIDAWSQPFSTLGAGFFSTSHRALELGNLPVTSLARGLGLLSFFFAGNPLASMDSLLQDYEQFLQHYQYHFNHNFSQMLRRCLGFLQADHLPDDVTLQETELSAHDDALMQWVQPLLQIHLHLLFHQTQKTFDAALKLKDSFKNPASLLYRGPYWTYALTSIYHGIEQGWCTRWRCRKILRFGLRQLRGWASHLPQDRQYRLTWVKAASLRSRSRGFLALEQYDKAIHQAKETGFQQDAALIAEQAASLCALMGHHRMAHDFRKEAIDNYKSWGAHAKVKQLQQLEPTLIQAMETPQTPKSSKGEHLLSTDNSQKPLELEAVLQVTEALSKESDEKVLIARIMHLVLKYAGAARGLLFLHQKTSWKLVAQAQSEQEDVQIPDTPVTIDEESNIASTAMLRYTILSHEPVVLADASQRGPFARDPYVLSAKPRSVLCLPILLRNQLLGLLYLENKLAVGVFTQQRQDLLSLILLQAAASLQLLHHHNSTSLTTPPTNGSSPDRLPPHPTAIRTLEEPLLQMPSLPSTASSRASSPVNYQVGDWSILRELAKGGMSVIYEAINPFTHQRAALKLLTPTIHEQGLRLRRFEREARLLERFHHPNIISLLDFDVDPKFGPFMALEYLEGETLQEIFVRHAPLPLGWWLPISEQLCDALATVHQKGVLHRDLKPSNIFITHGDPFPHLHLLDFGIADTSRVSDETRLTSTGVIVGTPAYLAPEQLKEKVSLTAATDLYALGVLWFEALTGEHPMGSGSSVELFVKILQETPAQLGDLRPEFKDTELEMLLSKLLSKNPRHRPDDVELLWNEISMSCQYIEDPSDTPERYPTI